MALFFCRVQTFADRIEGREGLILNDEMSQAVQNRLAFVDSIPYST